LAIDLVYRLGIKHSFDLFPKPLVERLNKETKQKFDIEHQKLVTAAYSQSGVEVPDAKETDSDAKTLKRQEQANQCAVLDELYKSYEDPGMIMVSESNPGLCRFP
jgi:tripeptidyl-peptidase II